MAESQTVVILRAKRDAIRAAIANYERQLEQAKNDFTHVTAALQIFEAEDDPGTQRVYVGLHRVFKYGEIANICRKALEAGPMTTPDLAKHVLAAKGLDGADRILARTVGFSVLQSLRGLKRRRVVSCARKRNRCEWRLG